MKPIQVNPAQKLRGVIRVPGDKSISHRAIIMASLSRGVTRIDNFLFSEDTLTTVRVLKSLGVKIFLDAGKRVCRVESSGRLLRPNGPLFMRESGTSARILLGLLSALPFESKVIAAPSLLRRPMGRVLDPLRQMGASLTSRQEDAGEYLPVTVKPALLHGIDWKQRVPSAQVKSAILLAGLFAQGETCVTEQVATRDHTERMLAYFGASLRRSRGRVCVRKSCLVSPKKIWIPGDISSAAFFIVAASILPGSRILLRRVGLNSGRIGLIRVLKRMGAKIRVHRQESFFEPVGDIEIFSASLKATVVDACEIPSLIDELPILMVACGLARGRSILKGVGELRVKETDRAAAMKHNLTQLGVRMKVKGRKESETIEIVGREGLFSRASLRSFSDHRTAMSSWVASLRADGPCRIDDSSCVKKSYPEFFHSFRQLFAA